MHEGKQLLIVDDEPEILDEMKEFLEEEGFMVDAVTSAKDALTVIKHKGNYSGLICDLKMEGMDGFDLMESLLELEPKFGVIAMSGHATEEDINAAMTLGCLDFIEKPFSLDRLLSAINGQFYLQAESV